MPKGYWRDPPRSDCLNCKKAIRNVWDVFCSRGCKKLYVRKQKRRGNILVEEQIRALVAKKAAAEIVRCDLRTGKRDVLQAIDGKEEDENNV